MSKYVYPDYYDDEDKANYDDLMSRGQALLGKKISYKEEYLLDMSAKITINQIKGYRNEMTHEEIREQMKLHSDALKENVVYTPENLYTEGEHPLEINKPLINQSYDDPVKREKHIQDLNLIQ